MTTIALEIDSAIKHLDPAASAAFERLLRDAMALANARQHPLPRSTPLARRQWIERLESLRARVATGIPSETTTESIFDDIRADRLP